MVHACAVPVDAAAVPCDEVEGAGGGGGGTNSPPAAGTPVLSRKPLPPAVPAAPCFLMPLMLTLHSMAAYTRSQHTS